MDRRTFLKGIPLAPLGVSMPAFVVANNSNDGFVNLTAIESTHMLGPSLKPDNTPESNLWLYNGQLPGPEIRVRIGQRLRVKFTNKLSKPSTVHWHGIRIDNAMDGVSGLTQKPVLPGESFDYDFVTPDAGTYWYHAHHESWNQVPRGLFGPLIVEEDKPAFDREHDITLVLNDWLVDKNNVFNESSLGSPMHLSHAGRLGNYMTVNGISRPDITLQRGEAYRLRLINTSSARILTLDPSRFNGKIIALDGQSLAVPVDTSESESPLVNMAPAQRVDLLVTPDKIGKTPLQLIMREPFVFAHLNIVAGSSSTKPTRPYKPRVTETLRKPDLTNATDISLSMMGGAMGRMDSLIYKAEKLSGHRFRETGQFWGFNGVANMAKVPLFSVKRGTTVKLISSNDTAFAHGIHVHGHHFQLFEKNGKPLSFTPWRDTFLVQRGEQVNVAFVADNPGKWLIHCHMLGHAVSGMMTWFEVS